MPVQLGGGIRDLTAIEDWIEPGRRRVILGTVAVRDPELVREAPPPVPRQIAVGVDVRDGKVAVEGWAETPPIGRSPRATGSRTSASPPSSTDINRDGAMTGVNVEATADRRRR